MLGKELDVKSYICSADGVRYPEKQQPIALQLSICPTSFCAASCPFCIATDTSTKQRIDLRRLEYVLCRLKEEGLVRGVSFTGGEPFTDMVLLNEAICLVFETLGFDTEVSVSTNGIGIRRLDAVTHLTQLEALHISRHHYDDERNRRLFGIRVPTAQELQEALRAVPHRDLFVLNCMLLRDEIGSPEEARRFLDFAIEVGAGKVAFITGTPINEYVRQQRVDYREVLRPDDPSMLFTRGFTDYHYCRCQDGVYASSQGEIIEFYGRSTDLSGLSYCRGLVYGADNRLRAGFQGEFIL